MRKLQLLFVLCLFMILVQPAIFAQQSSLSNTLVLRLGAEPSNLIDQLSSDSTSHEITRHLYVGLLRYDENLQIVPWAAENFSILDDGLRLKFTVRKDIRWHDGTELTAEDVFFTYQMMIDPNTPTAYAGDYKAVKEFILHDKYSFEVVYEKPFSRSLNTWMGAILPKHILEHENLRTTKYARQPVGCGPYIFDSWKPGVSITLLANPNYFEGKPSIDILVYRIVPEDTTAYLELVSQKLDLSLLTPQQVVFQTKEPLFANTFQLFDSLSYTYTFLGYNMTHPFFSDKRVRQALAYAINVQDIIKGALLGQGVPTVGPYRPDTWVYNTALAPYPHDMEKARQLLASAGWLPNTKGILEKNGQPFKFTILVNQENEVRIQTAIIIQHQLKKLGVVVDVRTVEWTAFLHQFVMPGYFDTVLLAWSIPLDPDSYDVWHSFPQRTMLNFIQYSNPELDVLLEEGRSTFDKSSRKTYYDKIQEILYDDQPYCFLYVPFASVAINKKVKGVRTTPLGIFYKSWQWQISADN